MLAFDDPLHPRKTQESRSFMSPSKPSEDDLQQASSDTCWNCGLSQSIVIKWVIIVLPLFNMVLCDEDGIWYLEALP